MCTSAHLRRFSSSCRCVFAAYLRTSLRNNTAHLCAHVHIYDMVVDVNFLHIYVIFVHTYVHTYVRRTRNFARRRHIDFVHRCVNMHIYVVLQVLVDVFLLQIYEQVYEINLHIYVHMCTSTTWYIYVVLLHI